MKNHKFFNHLKTVGNLVLSFFVLFVMSFFVIWYVRLVWYVAGEDITYKPVHVCEDYSFVPLSELPVSCWSYYGIATSTALHGVL